MEWRSSRIFVFDRRGYSSSIDPAIFDLVIPPKPDPEYQNMTFPTQVFFDSRDHMASIAIDGLKPAAMDNEIAVALGRTTLSGPT